MRHSSIVTVGPPTSITSTATATAGYGSFDDLDPNSESLSRTTNADANHSLPSSSLQRAALLYALDDTLVNNLSSNNIHSFFPVQEMIFPLLFGMQEGECVFKRDICVSAPTGSGKTLSYAIPIINSLLRDRRGPTNKVTSSAKTSSIAVETTAAATNFVSGLEALVVLPTRELANQVNNVFCRLLVGSSIKILCCTGNTSIKEEQSLLFGYYEHNQVSSLSAFGGGGGGAYDSSDSRSNTSRNSSSNNNSNSNSLIGGFNQDIIINILICTPGRLLEHINQTNNFSLKRLRYMVLDEADRLLGNAYHYWVKSLIESTQQLTSLSLSNRNSSGRNSSGRNSINSSNSSSNSRTNFSKSSMNSVAGGSKRSFEEMIGDGENNYSNKMSSSSRGDFSDQSRKSLQLLLFSATLTDNPRKLGMLGVKNPILLKLNKDSDKLQLPANLTESMRVCETSERPLILLAALAEAFEFVDRSSIASGLGLTSSDNSNSNISSSVVNVNTKHRSLCKLDSNSMCLIFASSVDTTRRLCKLLQIFNGQWKDGVDVSGNSNLNSYYFKGLVCEMSGELTSVQRESIMAEASKGKIKILVSSDHLSRGIDLPNCKLVINYDAPKFAKTYVHRVGRTARAEREGHSITLMKKGQQAIFMKMRSEIQAMNQLSSRKSGDLSSVVPKCKVAQSTLELMQPLYNTAMEQFKESLDDDE